MEHSRRKSSNFSGAAVVLLLLVILNAEMASVAAGTCNHLSGSFSGYCFRSTSCARTCKMESNDNIDGMCLDFISKGLDLASSANAALDQDCASPLD